jgi:phosphoglucomutase
MDLAKVGERLEQKYGQLGASAFGRLKAWLSGSFPYAFPELLEKHLQEERLDLLFDAFWQVLPFGTGGRRGRVGYGSNRFNPTTLAMTVQGHSNYLKKKYPGKAGLAVAVANDVRVFNDVGSTYKFLGAEHALLGTSSRSLARLACQIYAANGIVAYLNSPNDPTATLATPELAFLISQAPEIVGGVNLSASHNPPDDNGIKVYDEYGSQPIAPDDQHLVDTMDSATDVKTMPFEDALAQGLIRDLPADFRERYLSGYLEMFGSLAKSVSTVPITYTPLCGVGERTVGSLLTALKFPLHVPPDQKADGLFASIPFRAPNPEVPQSSVPACAFAETVGSTIVLSSDPDADRVGLEARLPDGTWYHFDGNQIAAILCYFLMLDPRGPKRRGLVIETLVTTKLLGKVVELAGGSALVDDLLVGFKYVADVLKRLERGEGYRGIQLKPDQLVVACEESHGVLMDHRILDKDASPACMYIAWLHQQLVAEGKTLLDYYHSIIQQVGGFDCNSRSIMMNGAEGMLWKNRIMASLREKPPTVLLGRTITKWVDYMDTKVFGEFLSETDKTPRDVLQFFTESVVLTVRPSGTEPKLKLYCHRLHDGSPTAGKTGIALLDEARREANRAVNETYNVLLERIEKKLDEAALALPDIIDLNLKVAFQEHTAPQLKQKLAAGTDLKAALEFLTEQSKAMTPGTNPLPALKAPVAELCRGWRAEGLSGALLGELETWARA